jgi:hypothetical protein
MARRTARRQPRGGRDRGPQAIEQGLPGVAAERLGSGARDVDLAHDRVDRAIERTVAPGAQRRQSRNDPLEMRRQ